MMNKIEEAIINATVFHQGRTRKLGGTPYILHPLEVAGILSTLTNDQDIIAAGILHDVVEDTDGTLEGIKERFGERVAFLVSSETENDYPGESRDASWKKRKEESLKILKNTDDQGVRMLWLADKLSNMRSIASAYSEYGEQMWEYFDQRDPEMHHWYYKSIAEQLELSLNRTGAFKEFIKHINFIWPGSFDSEKARYKQYLELSVEGCKRLGGGAKGDVYRLDDELIVKVYNRNNTYSDVEQEIAMARRAFILGIPTAISFGIVSVGDKYGAMYELVDSATISSCIARNPGKIDAYAKMMAELGRTLHSTHVTAEDGFPPAMDRVRGYIEGGIGREDAALAGKVMALLDALPATGTLLHGDFHTGNVFLQRGEPLLIDMDRLAEGHPIIELSDLYYYYVTLGEDDPAVVEKFMGFSYDTARSFMRLFLKHYLETEEEGRLNEVAEKASLIGFSRLIRKVHKQNKPSESDLRVVRRCVERITELTDRLDSLSF
ncbi:MAG: HD domain-containing protein [Oscillospiraceae bacterium]|nr:HD domain-containing protein [Oscillospiraceae bacterium]